MLNLFQYRFIIYLRHEGTKFILFISELYSNGISISPDCRGNPFLFLKKRLQRKAGKWFTNITTDLLLIQDYRFQIGLSIINGITTPITNADMVNVKSRLLNRNRV